MVDYSNDGFDEDERNSQISTDMISKMMAYSLRMADELIIRRKQQLFQTQVLEEDCTDAQKSKLIQSLEKMEKNYQVLLRTCDPRFG